MTGNSMIKSVPQRIIRQEEGSKQEDWGKTSSEMVQGQRILMISFALSLVASGLSLKFFEILRQEAGHIFEFCNILRVDLH